MKYYAYISDAKVNMLLPQITSAVKKRLTAELKLNLGVIESTIRERNNNVYSRVDNMRLVESYIRENETIGTINDYRGQETWIGDAHLCYVATLENDTAAVFFIGEDDRMVFALGGSSNHLIGSDSQSPVSIGWSFLPRMLRALRTFSEMEGDSYIALPEEPEQWHKTIELAIKKCQRSASPLIQIEFLARVLLSYKADQKLFVLASPLYVGLEH